MGPTQPPRKKRQHYVWQHYLRAWEDRGLVHCWNDGKVFKSGTEGLGVERYFYELRDLDDADEDLIAKLIDRCAPHLQPIAQGWHQVFTTPKQLAKAMGSWPEVFQGRPEGIRSAASDLEEELHCVFENVGNPLLDSLRAGTVPSPADMLDLLPFLATQFTRTKAIEESVRKATSGKMDRTWQVMRHVYAANIAIEILRSGQFKADLLEVPDGSRFITGDQPAINIAAVWNPEGVEAKELAFYYPVSPARALLVSKEASWTKRTVSSLEVNARNAAMAKGAHSQVYAHKAEDLEHVAADRRANEL